MALAGRFGFFGKRLPALLLGLTVLAAGLLATAISDVAAQEMVQRPWTLRDLFAPRKADRVEPRVVSERKTRARRKAAPKKTVAREQREPDAAPLAKSADVRTVIVVGDFMASGLAEGLTNAYAQDAETRIIDRTSGSSGFVRDDYYDWPEQIVDFIERDKPDAIVVMLGANDRQQMLIGETRETPLSENWSKEYSARTQALAAAISEREVPFVWVGVPPFKSPSMLSDMLAFNDFYRAAAAGVGAEFVDIWDGFVDENGGYVSTGPDLNGQPVRLRSDDGINLTRPGKRKLAFFVEKPLAKLLGETGEPGVAALAPAAASTAVAPPPVDIGSIKRTQPVSLQDPALDGGKELLGRVVMPKSEARSPGEKLAIEGIAPEPVPGRADDFSWAPAAAETTTAIRP